MSRIMGYTELKRMMEQKLPQKRFLHSLGVAETAKMLAERFSLDSEAALICGIYHDSYRYISAEEALKEVRMYSISIFKEEEENENLLHAPIAAYHMREDVGPVPSSYIKAVRYHTLGSKDMGALGAVIYIADYTEPGRKHLDDEERVRIYSEPTLEGMVRYIIEKQNVYFKAKGIANAAVTDELYDFLLKGGRFEK